jgi:peroxiredoxin
MKSFTFLLMIICALSTSCKEKGVNSSQSTVNDLPKMQVTTLDNSQVAINELEGNTILILFQPDCDHCQREAEEIRKNLDAFNGYAIYFISADQASAIQKFGADYDLLAKKNIYFALTTVDDVIKNFGSIPAPSLYIYSGRRLLKKFNGEVTIEKILESI